MGDSLWPSTSTAGGGWESGVPETIDRRPWSHPLPRYEVAEYILPVGRNGMSKSTIIRCRISSGAESTVLIFEEDAI